ncbi:hypothetical protein [Mariniflexile sp. AS56]|uniref:hypothetical protein n=1 Tax=Mariniflexile sp. AS56 TaxID=3063957 RepID=UPI0026F20E05|nr:hypothetical protein [Mariniflexile sp. AS56]MDO7171599.1 hypothetical protein [Mariniflexile sp. AS56]
MNIRGKIKSLICIGVLLCFTLAFSCNNQKDETLDIAEYLKHADGDNMYPSAKQIEMLKKVMPKNAFQPAPKISDRPYWNAVAATASGKEYLKKALSFLNEKPEVPISDEIYRRANKEGNRGIYKPRYYDSMERLEHFILAECLENKGRFLPQINTYLQAIIEMKSWLHPNHDDNDNSVLEGKRVTIDLGARRFASDLALAEVLLEDKLSKSLRNEIAKQLQYRIIDTYLQSCKTADSNNKWIDGTSNWNAVCTSGAVFTSIAIASDENQRLAAIGSALNSMKHYLSGFGADGYCSEGVGYWRYGFGHYLYLAQILSDYTGGKINLFEAHDAEKLKKVANFPENFHIQNNRFAPFSDGSSIVKNNEGNFAYVLAAQHYGSRRPTENILDQAIEQLIVWKNPEAFGTRASVSLKEFEVPDYSYFDDFGMVISRGKQKAPFSIAIKAGHNSENHNHSDVGTYILVLDDALISGDIGAPSYTAGAFSKDNKARSSWGHPVPRINNTLQSNGRRFEGKITETIFEDHLDKVVMDIKTAYELPVLKSLTRTMMNDKSGAGTITIQDDFVASEPVSFGTAIMTFSKYEIIDNHTVILTSGNQKIKAEVSGKGATIKMTHEQVPVEKLREGSTAYRIGIDFDKSIKTGNITIIYTPLN